MNKARSCKIQSQKEVRGTNTLTCNESEPFPASPQSSEVKHGRSFSALQSVPVADLEPDILRTEQPHSQVS